ncbi:hypothetical protein NL676_034767 [Syzygium grande]|nr:hypothetical protein NL676_034767 [Syzygium grande]
MVAILPFSPVKEKEDAICGGLSKLAADGQAQSQNKNILCFNLHEKNIFPLLLSLKRQKRKDPKEQSEWEDSRPVVPLRMLRITWSCIVLLCCSSSLHALNLNATAPSSSSKILVHPHQHPEPEAVVHDVNRRVNESVTRRQLLAIHVKDQCLTGNPIDDCWRCDLNWESNREHLADCAIGFGHEAIGGRGGNVYVVTDPSDPDPENPPLARSVTVLSKTDPSGSSSLVICHQHHHPQCAHSPLQAFRECPDPDQPDANGLIDVTEGSTAVTISNNIFTHHDKVMLLGHSDDFTADTGMQVTVAFNHFDEDLKERMPRCRFGYFHVVNNDYTQWGMYAVGGSSSPTINSQGNRYLAPQDDNNKEVTKRMDTDESEWRKWNWRSEGDLMVNGAFFVTSASSMSPLSANYIDQLTESAGVLVAQRSDAGPVMNPPPGSSGGIVMNPAAPGSSGGTVMDPGSSGGDGSSCYPGQGSSGNVPGTGGWGYPGIGGWGYPNNGISYGTNFESVKCSRVTTGEACLGTGPWLYDPDETSPRVVPLPARVSWVGGHQ